MYWLRQITIPIGILDINQHGILQADITQAPSQPPVWLVMWVVQWDPASHQPQHLQVPLVAVAVAVLREEAAEVVVAGVGDPAHLCPLHNDSSARLANGTGTIRGRFAIPQITNNFATLQTPSSRPLLSEKESASTPSR